MGYKSRDVEVTFLQEGICIIVSCDSCGAIGAKDLDVILIPAAITGRFTARVALAEVIASGAKPEIITVAIACEPEPTGSDILEGVRTELLAAGVENVKMVVSTEKNIPTRQTGLGISVIGSCDISDLRLGKTEIGDWIYGLGKLKVGAEVNDPDDPEIVRIEHLLQLLKDQDIHDLIPIGSGGIRSECELLAQEVQGRIEYDPNCPIPLEKSAGPATALIFTSQTIQNRDFGPLPFNRIGRVQKNYKIGEIKDDKNK